MKRGFQGAMLKRLGARDHIVTVTSVERITAHFIRIGFSSDTLFDEAETTPTYFLRFWFPDPKGSDREFQRAYTIIDGDARAGTFAVDIAVHKPAGPACTWAERAAVGDTLPVNVFSGAAFTVPEEKPAGYLLIGDAASIPAIRSIIETVPNDIAIEVYLEAHAPDDREIPLPEHPLMQTHWVERSGHDSLAAAIADRDWSNWRAWVAPESHSLKLLRTRLRDDFGFPRSEVHAQAYWVEGKEMGTDRSGPSAAGETADTAHDGSPEIETGGTASGAREPLGAAHLSAGDAAPIDPAAGTAEPIIASSRAVYEQSAPTAGASTRGTRATPRRGNWRAAGANRLLAPLKRVFIVAGILQGIIAVIELVPFVLLVQLAMQLLSGASTEELWRTGLIAIGICVGGALLSAALMLWLHLVDARFARDLRRRMLERLARISLGWFDNRSPGELKKIVQDDTAALHSLVTHAVPSAVAAVVSPIAVLGYLAWVDWRMTLVLFIPVLGYLVAMYLMVMRSMQSTQRAVEWSATMTREAGDYLDGQRVTRVFGGAAASSFRDRLGQYIAFLRGWQEPISGTKTVMDLATRPTTFLFVIGLMGTLLITTGAMAAVSILPFLLLGTTFGSKLIGIGFGLSAMREGMLCAREVQGVFDEPVLETKSGEVRHAAAGAVEFEGVRFEYRPGVPALEDINLALQPGTVTAIVGPSGSGKSTLAALLARFRDVSAGAIRIGGDDIRSFDSDELYRRIGFVFQDAEVVAGTVHDNIALARPEASRAEVERAADRAAISDRIRSMPHGFDEELTGNAALSGGEKQRLMIARAILADAPILVLDEATAYADPESEYLVQTALNELTTEKTVIVIAHRLRTITAADRIVVLDHGRIVESGTHDELLATRGRYRQLWDADGAGSIPVDAQTPARKEASE